MLQLVLNHHNYVFVLARLVMWSILIIIQIMSYKTNMDSFLFDHPNVCSSVMPACCLLPLLLLLLFCLWKTPYIIFILFFWSFIIILSYVYKLFFILFVFLCCSYFCCFYISAIIYIILWLIFLDIFNIFLFMKYMKICLWKKINYIIYKYIAWESRLLSSRHGCTNRWRQSYSRWSLQGKYIFFIYLYVFYLFTFFIYSLFICNFSIYIFICFHI